jgi:hypothetical protein
LLDTQVISCVISSSKSLEGSTRGNAGVSFV